MPEDPNNASTEPSTFISLLARCLRYPASRKPRFYFLVVISIIGVSYGLFFFIQHSIEDDTRNRLMNEQTERQLETTKKLSTDVTSDLVSIMAIMQGLANSQYLQDGDLKSEAARSLVQETFSKINSFTVVDKLFLLNKSDVVTMFMASEGENTLFFGADEVSFKDLIQEAKSKLEPFYTSGFKGTDGTERIALIYPVVSRASGDYLGSIVGLIPTIKFFEHYGNVHDINSQYLTAYDNNGSYLSHPSKKLVGLNFFSEEIQRTINHNRELNRLVSQVIFEGKPGYSIYDYAIGERLNSVYPIQLETGSPEDIHPLYSISVVTPTSEIYSAVNKSLFLERIGMFSLLAGTTVAILALLIFLHRWNTDLDKEVKKRTKQFEDANELLATANEKLKKQEKIQNEFINIAAHEIRTPLQPIIGYSAYALRGKVDVNYALDVIHRQAKRLVAMATDLLVITRIETGNFPYKMEKLRINDLIFRVINNIIGPASAGEGLQERNEAQYGLIDEGYYDALTVNEKNNGRSQTGGKNEFNGNTGIAQLKGDRKILRDDGIVGEFRDEYAQNSGVTVKYGDITITLDLDPQVGEIYADKDRISQVLSNIIQNSIKFTEVGAIGIKTLGQALPKISTIRESDTHSITNHAESNPTRTDEENQPMVEIEISDNGPGIPEDMMESLFEKFVTRDQSRRPNIHGTGLGLFICKSIVDYHGGNIRAWNNESGGATFSILLPLEKS
jgi:signal transduction histidine kinase